MQAVLRGVRITEGDAAGCTGYLLSIKNDKAVDYAYLKLQVLNSIAAYRVGYPQEAQTPAGATRMQVFAFSKDSSGNCEIPQAAVNDTIDIQSAAAGNMIVVHISRFARHSAILVGLATPSSGSSVVPAEKYFEGSYEYTILGQRVERPIEYRDLGVRETK